MEREIAAEWGRDGRMNDGRYGWTDLRSEYRSDMIEGIHDTDMGLCSSELQILNF
jgi:hypothetical protein